MGVIGFLLLIILPIYIVYSNFKTKEMLCKECGYSGGLRKQHRGSFLIEIILWCCFIIPGLIYSIWRSSNRFYQCPECLSRRVIPKDISNSSFSPESRDQIINKAIDEKTCPKCAEQVKQAALICRFCSHNFG